MSDSMPGPMCSSRCGPDLTDDGTLCGAASPFPEPEGMREASSGMGLQQALASLQATALNTNKRFSDLTKLQRRQVFEAIIESAGKSRPSVTAHIPRWRFAGRGLLFFTIAISTYNIWTAENKVRAGLKEGIVWAVEPLAAHSQVLPQALFVAPEPPYVARPYHYRGQYGRLDGSAVVDHYDAKLLEF